MHPPSRSITLFDGSSSAATSTYTSNPLLVADYSQYQAISVETVAAVASRFTVQGTLDDGLTSAIRAGSWSNLTVLTVPGKYTVDPGVRFIRVLRSALESTSTVQYVGA